MEQCPVCLKLFASSNNLVSHLHQSKCRSALFRTNSHNILPTNSSTLPTDSVSSIPPRDDDPPTNNAAFYRPLSMNAFGDFIVHGDEDDSSAGHATIFSKDTDESDGEQFAGDATAPTDSSDVNSTAGADTLNPLTNLISTIREDESFNVPVGHDDKLIPMLKMIKAVREAGAPIALLDTLVKIIKEEWQFGRFDITHLCTHKTALNRISKMFPALPTPTSVTVTHERTVDEMNRGMERPSLTFPCFSFLGQFQDLLDDHIFSDLKNLVDDPENRWEHYQPNSCPHSFDEIQDGRWFQGIVEQVRNYTSADSIPDFAFGIQGYIDKTGTDALQRNSIEPLVFTLTLFTNPVRNQDKSWRVLALLPASLSQKQRKKHSFGASVRNYHIALRHALDEFIHLQKNPPIVRLRLGDQFRYVRAHLYWVNTIADGLANESLTGRIQNRNTSPRLSRGCHCPQHLADDSTLVCKYLRQSAIERLTVAALGPAADDDTRWNDYVGSLQSMKERKAAQSALKTRKRIAQAILNNVFGQHVVDLVWFHVNQGPNPRGCFGSTPVDPMHAVEEGIIPYIMSVIIDPLPESLKSRLDALALKIIACNRWDTDYPRMNFSGGFCSLTQLTADEKVGKMVLLWIIMQTTIGRDIIDLRCNPTFDEQRVTRAARFSSKEIDSFEDDSEQSDISQQEPTHGHANRHFIGSAVQLSAVDSCLRDNALDFVIPWIKEMIPCHQEILRRIVFQIDCNRGKTKRHELPSEPFLDRHLVTADSTDLYFDEPNEAGNALTQSEQQSREARYSVDCTSKQLQDLIEMILSFHAAYKYGNSTDKTNFNRNLRLMMARIKSQINRGGETKNWAISKFHELLHMVVDTVNFGSHTNVDAGKGEHGLKKWAKLPSKTVRTRDANNFYQDLARRIYEYRLIQLATETLMPRNVHTLKGNDNVDSRDDGSDEHVTIVLTHLLMKLNVIGPSLLPIELTAYLRGRPNLVFPLDVYQEARYSMNDNHEVTIRGTHKYRNSGPWNDCVLVSYEDDSGERKEYPFQVHGFFIESGKQQRLAVGKMGLKKNESSRLLDSWTYEKNYRIVEMETISSVAFALTILETCFKEESDNTPYRMYVLKDRINEWPKIFNDDGWEEKTRGTKKRKR